MPIPKPSFDLDINYQQLAFELDLEEIEFEGISADEARVRSEIARKSFEKSKDFGWVSEYLSLRNGGWPWRQAAYIAWSASPKVNRNPKTQEDLATQVLGLGSDRAISTWNKRNPAIEEMIGVLQASPLFEYRAEIYRALIANAIKPDYKTHNDRKLALEMMGDYIPASKIAAELTKRLNADDLKDMSDAELAKLAAGIESELKEKE
ncbi:MAG: hypothetical protein HYX49_08895 [Chloroflexi bacterium]|nr:hypothetical protein [Chloroflexota bacterium]